MCVCYLCLCFYTHTLSPLSPSLPHAHIFCFARSLVSNRKGRTSWEKNHLIIVEKKEEVKLWILSHRIYIQVQATLQDASVDVAFQSNAPYKTFTWSSDKGIGILMEVFSLLPFTSWHTDSHVHFALITPNRRLSAACAMIVAHIWFVLGLR